MSLYKQLWLAIVFLLLLVFGVSVVISSVSAKRYLEQQLAIKNSDNATALALSLTQQGADPVLMELTLSAQFDTGFYSLIRLTAPEGEILLERSDANTATLAPQWFVGLLPITAEPGRAAIQQGWRQAATLELRSNSRFAYDELWRSTQRMAFAFFLTALAAGIMGSLLLRRLLAPLQSVVDQASAIGDRRFVTLREPQTREFREVVAAMNRLSERVRTMLASEGERLEELERANSTDSTSGLLNRAAFNARLESTLAADDDVSTGVVCIARISNLMRLNQDFGRTVVDGALTSSGLALNALCREKDWTCGRLNGSDIALLAPRADNATRVGMQLQDTLSSVMAAHSLGDIHLLPVACCDYHPGDSQSSLFTLVDAALVTAERSGDSEVVTAQRGTAPPASVRDELAGWRATLGNAFAGNNYELAIYPVRNNTGETLHDEALVRLRKDGELLTAANFLPWINRLQLAGELDRRVVELGLLQACAHLHPLAINLSTAALADDAFPAWLDSKARDAGAAAGKLWLEVAESVAYQNLACFHRLCDVAHRYGMKVGMDRVGRRLADLGQLHDLGIDYVKLDAVFVRDIESNIAHQNLLRTLSTLVHAVGVTVIADGVERQSQWTVLENLGVDAVGGPGAARQR